MKPKIKSTLTQVTPDEWRGSHVFEGDHLDIWILVLHLRQIPKHKIPARYQRESQTSVKTKRIKPKYLTVLLGGGLLLNYNAPKRH